MWIRDAEPNRDGVACAAVYAPSVTERVASFEERAPTGVEMSERIAAVQRGHPWLVAGRDETVAGYAYGAPHRARTAYRWSTEVTIYVADAFHRRGLGRALYERLLGRLTEQGFTVALAGITLPNAASVGLHEALGFRRVGVYRAVGYKFGRPWDVGWWQRGLAPAPTDGAPPEPLPPALP